MFARAGRSDALLFAVLTRAVEECVGDFTAQDLTNTAWAFVTADQVDTLLLTALAVVAEQQVGNFKAQGLADTARAFGRENQ